MWPLPFITGMYVRVLLLLKPPTNNGTHGCEQRQPHGSSVHAYPSVRKVLQVGRFVRSASISPDSAERRIQVRQRWKGGIRLQSCAYHDTCRKAAVHNRPRDAGAGQPKVPPYTVYCGVYFTQRHRPVQTEPSPLA